MQPKRSICLSMFLLATQVAWAATQVTYTLETGGDNHADQWESGTYPAFTSGVTDGSTTVEQGQDLTWAVRVGVSGAFDGGMWVNLSTDGAANLLFDLALFQADGTTPVNIGAATLDCASGEPGEAGALDCRPVTAGFWSSINDGDADGARGQDLLANGAFAIAIYNGVPKEDPSGPGPLEKPVPMPTNPSPQLRRLIDPIVPETSASYSNTAGPNFDYGWYPTANGRGGIDLRGTQTPDTSISSSALIGRLVGFGAGYRSFEYTHYRAGVGLFDVDTGMEYYGFGNPSDPQPALFEGQISTIGLAPGTYVLRVFPSAIGSTVLHPSVSYSSLTPDYTGFSVFAARAESVAAVPADGIQFTVVSTTPP